MNQNLTTDPAETAAARQQPAARDQPTWEDAAASPRPPAPPLVMFNAGEAASCTGDGCVVTFTHKTREVPE